MMAKWADTGCGCGETNFDRVIDFMTTFGQEVKSSPEFPAEDITDLRLNLIDEEYIELQQAVNEYDIVAVADALTDLLYVIYGAGAAFGIDLDACFKEVHASNMSKLLSDRSVLRREDGKILKGPNYFVPYLKKVLDIK